MLNELMARQYAGSDRANEEFRRCFVLKLTPPGSACSIALGTGLTQSVPGSVQGLQMVVSDIDATHADLMGRGVDVSETEDLAWGSFVSFRDPDGNGWSIQQITPRT